MTTTAESMAEGDQPAETSMETTEITEATLVEAAKDTITFRRPSWMPSWVPIWLPIAAVPVILASLSLTVGIAIGNAGTSTASNASTAASDITVPATSDFTVTLKVVDQQCFGSAGCLVEVKPLLSYIGATALDPSETFQVTYTITGDESGPAVDTLTVTGDKYIGASSRRLRTGSAYTSITADVTSVEES